MAPKLLFCCNILWKWQLQSRWTQCWSYLKCPVNWTTEETNNKFWVETGGTYKVSIFFVFERNEESLSPIWFSSSNFVLSFVNFIIRQVSMAWSWKDFFWLTFFYEKKIILWGKIFQYADVFLQVDVSSILEQIYKYVTGRAHPQSAPISGANRVEPSQRMRSHRMRTDKQYVLSFPEQIFTTTIVI